MIEIAEVKTCVQMNLKEIHFIGDVAEKLGVATETLKKTFLRIERISLSEYIIKAKVDKMKEELIHSDEKCLVICLTVGLREDTGARLFKKTTGMRMLEFRKAHGEWKGQEFSRKPRG